MRIVEARKVYDLEDRLVALAAAICRIVARLPTERVAGHIAGQPTCCGTAPASN